MMNFNWEKKGKIFDPTGRSSWMQCYAQVPTPFIMGDVLRLFFTTRHIPEGDKYFVSNIGYVDVDINDFTRELGIAEQPVLPAGEPGTFDEFGLMPGCIVEANGYHYMYYTGWSRGYTVPYITSIGLAISKDGGKTYTKAGNGPVMSRTRNEPYLENGPYVIIEKGVFHMWYASGIEWIKHNERFEPVYVIKHATSTDGINWNRDGKACLENAMPNESNGRPWVMKMGEMYYMWYCYRASVDYRGKENGYRMGFAVSTDLVNWTRKDEMAGLDVSDSGWDSEMVAYPGFLSLGEKMYLFYNGNGFGKDGFGFAELKNKN